MPKNKDVLARPSVGTKCLYDVGSFSGAFDMYGVYFVEIIKYIKDMPVCIILKIIERAPSEMVTHEVGKEVFFIVKASENPNEILKEII